MEEIIIKGFGYLTTLIVFGVMATIMIAFYDLVKPLPPINKRQYRIVRDMYAGYQAEVKTNSWILNDWVNMKYCGTWYSKEEAKKAIEQHKKLGEVVN